MAEYKIKFLRAMCIAGDYIYVGGPQRLRILRINRHTDGKQVRTRKGRAQTFAVSLFYLAALLSLVSLLLILFLGRATIGLRPDGNVLSPAILGNHYSPAWRAGEEEGARTAETDGALSPTRLWASSKAPKTGRFTKKPSATPLPTIWQFHRLYGSRF